MLILLFAEAVPDCWSRHGSLFPLPGRAGASWKGVNSSGLWASRWSSATLAVSLPAGHPMEICGPMNSLQGVKMDLSSTVKRLPKHYVVPGSAWR